MKDILAKIKIESETILTLEYNEFLYELYLPLIKKDAVFLYEFLVNLVRTNNNELTIEELIKKSTFDFKDFVYNRKMLESVGLIRTYKNSDNEYLIRISAIYSPKRFFEDPVFKGMFIDRVGKEKAEKILKKYEISEVSKKYKDISATINDNFYINFDPDNLSIGGNVSLISTKENKPKDNFDELKFRKFLEKNFSNYYESITDEEVYKAHNLGTLYGLSEEIVGDYFMQSFNYNNPIGSKLDFERLDTYLKAHVSNSVVYQNLTKNKTRKRKLDGDSTAIRNIEYYQSVSPREFLRDKQNGSEPVKSDLNIISYLSTAQKLPNDVINVILEYTLKQQGGSLPRDYIEKIAATLKRRNVKDALDALNVLGEKNKDFSIKVATENVKKDKKADLKEELDDDDFDLEAEFSDIWKN